MNSIHDQILTSFMQGVISALGIISIATLIYLLRIVSRHDREIKEHSTLINNRYNHNISNKQTGILKG
jgi:hypothetical protein